MAKTKTKKIITAGSLVIEAVYPRVDRRDGDRTRQAKRRLSSEAQQRMNQIYSYQKLELQLAANYRSGDLFATFTYDDRHLPVSRAEALQRLRYGLNKINASRKARGEKAVVHWCTEHKHESETREENRRWHHHLIINATAGEDFEELRRCWIYGQIQIEKIKIDATHSFEALARYMAKESRDRLGQRSWSYSRNAKRPEVETFRVEADTKVTVPEGALELGSSSGGEQVRTGWIDYQVVKYLAPGWDSTVGQPVRRRRRRRKS